MPKKISKVRTRIAPSPTGYFHIGTLRTALFNYLFAKKHHGQFILRVEDTDQARSLPKYEKDILTNLKWAGLKWDELYKQSDRTKIYRQFLEKLLANGQAYEDEIIWFKNPNKKVIFNDLIRGPVEFDSSTLGDFSLAKDLETPLYNLAVVIDDYQMKISHVIRGEDHISNTPKQILIQEALGLPTPQYAHLPLILGPDRSKMSKRQGTVAVKEYQADGYLATALLNFVALLGWNPGDNREIFSLKELVKEFSLERVQKGGAIFDVTKLDWFNGHYLKKLPLTEFIKLAQPYLKKNGLTESNINSKKISQIYQLEQERVKKLSEVGESIKFFFKKPTYKTSLLNWKKIATGETKTYLQQIFDILNQVKEGDYQEEKLKEIALTGIGSDNRGRWLWPWRVALSGQERSPSPFIITAILGKKVSLERIKKAIRLIK